MTLREQVEALPGWHFHDVVERQAVLDLIDAHRCIDPERLARALTKLEWWRGEGGTDDARERQCECGAYFTHGNAKRKYCTDACRMAFNYQRRKRNRMAAAIAAAYEEQGA